ERDTHPERNKLFNCLGAPTLPDVDIAAPVALESGDTLLLCSDGLWGVMPDGDLVAGLLAMPLAQSVPSLLQRATRIAGDTGDNATALALTWIGDDVATDGFDDCPTTVMAENMPTQILDGFAQAPEAALTPAHSSSFADEFAAEFGVPLSATIAALPHQHGMHVTADELDKGVSQVQAALAKASSKP
ncbi:MAG TPA: hypothetical protein VIT92_02435, partial [Burkholderiaceae bacterium]